MDETTTAWIKSIKHTQAFMHEFQDAKRRL